MICNNPYNFGTLFPFITQYTPVIPKLYWDVESDEQRIKWLSLEWDRIYHYLLDLFKETNQNADDIAEFKKQFEEFKSHGFDEYYRKQIETWILNNFADIIDKAIQVLFFGLTDDGYFCAYVPTNWSKYMSFDTGAVYGADDYGCLKIAY